jgi:hypothetical protein
MDIKKLKYEHIYNELNGEAGARAMEIVQNL